MTTAYGQNVVDVETRGQGSAHFLPFIPLQICLQDGSYVCVDFIRGEEDEKSVKKLLNDVIEEGMSWPFEHQLTDAEFRNYFFSHTALVVRHENGKAVGAFYCKPNFPGRCSHYCNGGFITDPIYRRRGIGRCMGTVFLRVARALKFKAVLFNLVFCDNKPSVRLWESLGFEPLARLPKVGRLKAGYSDAIQYYYNLEDSVEGRRRWIRDIFHATLHKVPIFCSGVMLFLVGKCSGSR